MYQTKSGSARHVKVNHQQSGWKYRTIEKDFLLFLLQSVSENLCYSDSVRDTARNYNFESCDELLENVNGLKYQATKSNDPDAFYSSFTSLISSNTETFFTALVHFTATIMAMNLARQIHQEFLKQKEQSTKLDGFQYSCG